MLAKHQGRLFLTLFPQWIDGGCARGREGTQPERWPELTRDTPCLIMVMLSNKMERRGFRWVGHLLFGNWLGIWWVIAFASLVLFSFLLLPLLLCLLIYFYLDPQIFLLLFFHSSFPIPLGEVLGEWGGGCMVLGCLPELSCNNMFG